MGPGRAPWVRRTGGHGEQAVSRGVTVDLPGRHGGSKCRGDACVALVPIARAPAKHRQLLGGEVPLLDLDVGGQGGQLW